MGMTKKEKAGMDAAILKAETLAALRWTTQVEPDLLEPENYTDIINGWSFNSYSMVAGQSWSSAYRNGSGTYKETSSASQDAKKQYSSKLLALKAMRNAVERECAKKLLLIDKMTIDEVNN
jgi:hypothetical protein